MGKKGVLCFLPFFHKRKSIGFRVLAGTRKQREKTGLLKNPSFTERESKFEQEFRFFFKGLYSRYSSKTPA